MSSRTGSIVPSKRAAPAVAAAGLKKKMKTEPPSRSVEDFVPSVDEISPRSSIANLAAMAYDGGKKLIAALAQDPRGDATEPRYAQRERTSTLVYIDGQPVLAKNNYIVKGMTYVKDAHGAQLAPPTKRSANADATVKKPPQSRLPRVPTEAEVRRSQFNRRIRERRAEKQTIRSKFLASNLYLLEPFLEPKVLRAFKGGRKGGNPKYCDEGIDDLLDEFIAEQPSTIVGQLRDYQMEGLRWMASMHKKNLGMILGDEMGLGKTLQTIALICYLKETHGITGPSLVICPLSVVYTWIDEITKWAPHLKFLRLHASSIEEREAQKSHFKENAFSYDIVVTTYEMVKNPNLGGLWARQHFNYVVLDEGHIIKNPESQISIAVRKLHFENVLILTGTPLQNNLVELWSLLNFLCPDIFTSSEPFAESFDITKKLINRSLLTKAHGLLEMYMLRRMKTEVEKLLPKKIETKVYCPLSKQQIHLYKGLLLKDMDLLVKAAEAAKGKSDSKPVPSMAKKVQMLIMQLRKCCNHPFVFEDMEADIDATTMEELIGASGKLAVLDKLLRNLFLGKHRAVIFSQFTKTLDIIEDYCNLRGWRFCRLDGSTSRAQRNFLCKNFNEPDSGVFIFLLSTRAGGMGLNLQSADTCILFDSDWNPQVDIQAMARVHRLGQKKIVHVYRLITGESVEERMVERAEKKLFLDKMVNHGKAENPAKENKGVSQSEILNTLRFGCDAVFGEASKGKNTLPTDEDIDFITDRERAEDSTAGDVKGGVALTAESFDIDMDLTATTKFQGYDFKAMQSQRKKDKEKNTPKSLRDISIGWDTIQTEKRKRKNRIEMVKGLGSGYGSKFIPVLSMNNYDIESGEPSVQRELKSKKLFCDETFAKPELKPKKKEFLSEDSCLCCGESGGDLMPCTKCPNVVHRECVDVYHKNIFMCPHHRCSNCERNMSNAGGLLFPCQSCPNSFCEDCIPTTGTRILGACERFQKLGFNSQYSKQFAYIHCSEYCEQFAKQKFNWVLHEQGEATCPPKIDVSSAFGGVNV